MIFLREIELKSSRKTGTRYLRKLEFKTSSSTLFFHKAKTGEPSSSQASTSDEKSSLSTEMSKFVLEAIESASTDTFFNMNIGKIRMPGNHTAVLAGKLVSN